MNKEVNPRQRTAGKNPNRNDIRNEELNKPNKNLSGNCLTYRTGHVENRKS